MRTMTESFEALRAVLLRDGAPSSDFDLNPEFALPDRRLTEAAVLIGLGEGAGGLTVLLTKRSSRLKHHPGQIAFPGGKRDAGDASLADTALREAREEVGLDPAQVEILGSLPAHETVTGFAVTPVVARIAGRFTPCCEPGEVDEAFELPLAHAADPARYRVEQRLWRGQLRSYYALPWGPYYVWGATARMLRALALRLAP